MVLDHIVRLVSLIGRHDLVGRDSVSPLVTLIGNFL